MSPVKIKKPSLKSIAVRLSGPVGQLPPVLKLSCQVGVPNLFLGSDAGAVGVGAIVLVGGRVLVGRRVSVIVGTMVKLGIGLGVFTNVGVSVGKEVVTTKGARVGEATGDGGLVEVGIEVSKTLTRVASS